MNDLELIELARNGSEYAQHSLVCSTDFTLVEKWYWTHKLHDLARLYSDFQYYYNNKCDTNEKKLALEKAFCSIWPNKVEGCIHIVAALDAKFK